MLIAKIVNNEVIKVEDYRLMFPLTVFESSGPSKKQMEDFGCLHVNLWKPYDAEKQTLRSVSPYIEGEWVYMVVVDSLTQEELDARTESRKQTNKNRAAQLLVDSDFYDLPNTASKIVNIDEITLYRDEVRAIALSPEESISKWPVKPKTIWK